MEDSTNAAALWSTQQFDARKFRHALGRFASGVTVITVEHQGRPHGMTANSFVSVSLSPPLILVSLDNRSFMHSVLRGIGRFGISVLGQDQEPLSNHFAGRIVPDLHVRFTRRGGIPMIEGSVAYFVVRLEDVHPAGDHTLYISRVEEFEWNDERPLLFYAGQYRHLGAEPTRDKIKLTPDYFEQDEFSLFSIGAFDPPVK
jgi:flavin reductase (DIM6/NTAB) family NADH-FMN oxidoreductase RutF